MRYFNLDVHTTNKHKTLQKQCHQKEESKEMILVKLM